MKKSTKIITTVVAMCLIVGAMIVGIWAAAQQQAGIRARVRFTATDITAEMAGAVFGYDDAGTAFTAGAPKTDTYLTFGSMESQAAGVASVATAAANFTDGVVFYEGSESSVPGYYVWNIGQNALDILNTPHFNGRITLGFAVRNVGTKPIYIMPNAPLTAQAFAGTESAGDIAAGTSSIANSTDRTVTNLDIYYYQYKTKYYRGLPVGNDTAKVNNYNGHLSVNDILGRNYAADTVFTTAPTKVVADPTGQAGSNGVMSNIITDINQANTGYHDIVNNPASWKATNGTNIQAYDDANNTGTTWQDYGSSNGWEETAKTSRGTLERGIVGGIKADGTGTYSGATGYETYRYAGETYGVGFPETMLQNETTKLNRDRAWGLFEDLPTGTNDTTYIDNAAYGTNTNIALAKNEVFYFEIQVRIADITKNVPNTYGDGRFVQLTFDFQMFSDSTFNGVNYSTIIDNFQSNITNV